MKNFHVESITPPEQSPSQNLSLQDLLVDAENDILSEYLSLSISRQGGDAKISLTTTDTHTTTYSSVVPGLPEIDPHSLLTYLLSDTDPNTP